MHNSKCQPPLGATRVCGGVHHPPAGRAVFWGVPVAEPPGVVVVARHLRLCSRGRHPEHRRHHTVRCRAFEWRIAGCIPVHQYRANVGFSKRNDNTKNGTLSGYCLQAGAARSRPLESIGADEAARGETRSSTIIAGIQEVGEPRWFTTCQR